MEPYLPPFDPSLHGCEVGATLMTTVAGAYIASRGLLNFEADPNMAVMMEEEATAGRRARLRPEDVLDDTANTDSSASRGSDSSPKK